MPDDVQVIQKQSTSEVIATPSETSANLSALFDKMESVKGDGGTANEAITEFRQEKASKPAEKVTAPVTEEKKQVTQPDKKPEVKKEEPKAQTNETTSDDPRDALRKSFEKRQQTKDDGKTETEAKDEKHEDDIPDEELKPLPTDKPKTVKRIQALLKKVEMVSNEKATTAAERDAKNKELEELRKQLATTQTANPETEAKLKQAHDELAQYRRRYELDNDPEVKSKFDGRVESAEKSIIDTLKRRNASEGLLNLIKDSGGWEGFSSSSRTVAVPDGEGGQEQISTAELAERIMKSLPLGERKAVEAAMMEQISTKRERDRYFKDEQAKANEYFKKKEEESGRQAEEHKKQVESAQKTADEFIKKIETSDWLKDKEIPATATAEEKKAVQDFNDYNKQIRSQLKKALNTSDTTGLLSIVEDSLLYWNERRTTASLQEENARLKAELKAKDDKFAKFQRAGGSVPKQGSISTPAPKDDDEDDNKPASSLDDQLRKIEARKAARETLFTNR